MKMMLDFKAFLLRGNILELAIAIVIGVAFGDLVTAVVEDLMTPLIAAIIGEPDFSGLTFTINSSVFYYGDFINKLISFISIVVVVYFLVVVPVRRLTQPFAAPADPTTRKCSECLSIIPLEASRCAFCTAIVTPIV